MTELARVVGMSVTRKEALELTKLQGGTQETKKIRCVFGGEVGEADLAGEHV